MKRTLGIPRGIPLGIPLATAALLLLTACHGGKGEPPPKTFTLTASPDGLRIPSGGSAYVVVTLSRLNGFAEPVELDLTGAPAGVIAKATIPATGASTTLPILLAAGTAPQTLDQLQLRGTAGTLVRTVPLHLQILAPLPSGSYSAHVVQAAGATQTSKGTTNQAIAGESLQAREGVHAATRNRSGFHPTGQSQQ